MFDQITINRQSTSSAVPIDLGFLAECLVFYKKVLAVVDVESFRFLVRCCGPDELLELLSMGVLDLEFFDNITGVPTIETNVGPLHDLATITSHKTRFPQVARALFDELAGSSGKGANKWFKGFSRYVMRSEYTKEILEKSRGDWLDEAYVVPAVRSLLSFLAPEYIPPEPLIFTVKTQATPTGTSFRVSTNVDFDAANVAYHLHVPKEHSSLSEAYILISLADTRRDLIVGSRHSSDFALAPERSLLASCKFAEIIAAATSGVRVLDLFQEEVVDDLPRIGDVVNSGEKNFRDVIHLVQKAEKFKEWMAKHGSSRDIRAEYCRDATRVEWADKLPTKSFRWLVITAATTVLGVVGGPIAGTAAATALSAADFFLLDKLLKGWRPSQFIEGPLKQFLRIS